MARRSSKPAIPRSRVKTAQAVALLGVEPRTVRDMAMRGEIPGAAKLRGIWTFDLALLEQLIQENESTVQHNARQARNVSVGGMMPAANRYRPEPTSGDRCGQVIDRLRKLAKDRIKGGRP